MRRARGASTPAFVAWGLAICLAMSLALTLSGCGPALERPGASSRGAAATAQVGPAPAYHRPSAWWRAQHSAQLGGAGALWPWARPAHDLGECLVCHRPAVSCEPCHAYVGVAAVKGGR